MRLPIAMTAMLMCVLTTDVEGAWSDVPLAKWQDGQTLEVLRKVEPPFGTWTEKDGRLLAQGQDPCWSTRLRPGDAGAGSRVTVGFTVEESSKLGCNLGVTGGYAAALRWGTYWGENNPGWDVGVVVRWTDALNYYRVSLSAHRGELALWDSSGGFLQVVPCPVKLKQKHTLEIVAHGAHFQAKLDGKLVMDYWDRTLPHARGQVGLSVWKSKVRFDRFDVQPIAGPAGEMPPHEPDFALKPIGGTVWVTDRGEPICQFTPRGKGKKAQLGHHNVKLKPGWRSMYMTWIGPGVMPGNGYAAGVLPLVGKLPEALNLKTEGETLELSFKTERPGEMRADHDLVIRYDTSRGVYRYEYDSTLTVTSAKPLRIQRFEMIDPLTYNNRSPAPGVTHKWHGLGHEWMVFEGKGGKWERYPLVDYLGPYNQQPTAWKKESNFLYPDPAACPVFETTRDWKKAEGKEFLLGLCHWGYDFHHFEGNAAVPVAPGTKRRYTVTMTAMPPAQAEAIFKRSAVAPKVLPSREDKMPVFDAAGSSFDMLTSCADPKATIPWYGGTVDASVGRTDSHSLRIDGPDRTHVRMHQHALEVKRVKRWLVRGWTKSKDVGGRGLQLRIRYSYRPQPEQVFYLDGRGSRDWTAFSFITTVLTRSDCTDIDFELDGAGTVWIDDFSITPLKPGETPKVTRFPEPSDMQPSKELLIDLSTSEKPGKGIYDASHNGHHLMLDGPTWTQEGGRAFLRFDGVDDTSVITVKPALIPRKVQGRQVLFPLNAFTYETWFRVRPKQGDTRSWFTIFHFYRSPNAQVRFKNGKWGFFYSITRYQGKTVTLDAPVQPNQWVHAVVTHADGKVSLYINGKPAGQGTYDPKGQGFEFQRESYHLGNWLGRKAHLRGDLGPFRLYTRALTAKEVRERYRTGWPKAH